MLSRLYSVPFLPDPSLFMDAHIYVIRQDNTLVNLRPFLPCYDITPGIQLPEALCGAFAPAFPPPPPVVSRANP